MPRSGRAAVTAWLAGAGIVATLVLHRMNPRDSELTTWWLASLTMALSLGVPGWLILRGRPGNVVGGLLLGAGALQVLTAASREYGVLAVLRDLPAGTLAITVSENLWVVSAGLIVLLVVLFPDGRPLTARWRWVVAASCLATAMLVVAGLLRPAVTELGGGGTRARNPLGWDSPVPAAVWTSGAGLQLLVLVLMVVGVALRYRRSVGVERLQMQWFVPAAGLAALELPVEVLLPDQVGRVAGPLVVALMAAAVAVAVLRHRLYDIDVVVNRGLVYLALSGCLVGAYLLAAVLLGVRLDGRVPLGGSLAAAVLVALALAPLRQRLQHGVDRMMYGERADGYAVLAAVSRETTASTTPAESLDVLCRTVARALRLPYVAVEADDRLLAAVGRAGVEPAGTPVQVAGRAVGRLLACPRPGEPTLSRVDATLLADVSGHVGAMIRAFQLTEQLLISRQQLVEAREDERRRIRRDLHDGLGPTLAAVRMTGDAAAAMVTADPTGARRLLTGLGHDVEDAIADVRRLVHELRPAVLDEFGLVRAVRQQAERLTRGGCVFEVVAADPIPALSAAVEVAAYRILTEAMTNVARHARASRCTVRVEVDGRVRLSVEDDGDGVARPCPTAGVGLTSIRERASELGGTSRVESIDPHGTRVVATLPLGSTR